MRHSRGITSLWHNLCISLSLGQLSLPCVLLHAAFFQDHFKPKKDILNSSSSANSIYRHNFSYAYDVKATAFFPVSEY